MINFYQRSLSDLDRRRYAAVEASVLRGSAINKILATYIVTATINNYNNNHLGAPLLASGRYVPGFANAQPAHASSGLVRC